MSKKRPSSCFARHERPSAKKPINPHRLRRPSRRLSAARSNVTKAVEAHRKLHGAPNFIAFCPETTGPPVLNRRLEENRFDDDLVPACNCEEDCVEYPDTICGCESAKECCKATGFDHPDINFAMAICPVFEEVDFDRNDRKLQMVNETRAQKERKLDGFMDFKTNHLCFCDLIDCGDIQNLNQYCDCEDGWKCCQNYANGFLDGAPLAFTCPQRDNFRFHMPEPLAGPLPMAHVADESHGAASGRAARQVEGPLSPNKPLKCKDYAWWRILPDFDYDDWNFEFCIEDGAWQYCHECGACPPPENQRCEDWCFKPKNDRGNYHNWCQWDGCEGCPHCHPSEWYSLPGQPPGGYTPFQQLEFLADGMNMDPFPLSIKTKLENAHHLSANFAAAGKK